MDSGAKSAADLPDADTKADDLADDGGTIASALSTTVDDDNAHNNNIQDESGDSETSWTDHKVQCPFIANIEVTATDAICGQANDDLYEPVVTRRVLSKGQLRGKETR